MWTLRSCGIIYRCFAVLKTMNFISLSGVCEMDFIANKNNMFTHLTHISVVIALCLKRSVSSDSSLFSVCLQRKSKALFETGRGNDTNDVICVRGWLLRRHSRCCPSASCRFEPHPLQTHTFRLHRQQLFHAWVTLVFLDTQTEAST